MPKLENALLVYPQIPKDTYWSYSYSLKLIQKKSAMPPLGLATLAALFPADVNVRIIDLNIEPLEDKDLDWADAVFLSAMIVQKDSAMEVLARCKDRGVPVVAGGPYPTATPEDMADADYLIQGEAEEVFTDFIEAFRRDEAPARLAAPKKPPMSASPIPRFDLLNRRAYASMSVQYSRGCPFKCDFCNVWKLYGNRPRLKSASQVLAEMDYLYELGWRDSVFIVDDNFIGNKGKVKKELLPALIAWQKEHGYPFTFFTEASINLAEDDRLLTDMKEAGFTQVFIGIETPSAESLAEVGKKQNPKSDMVKAVKKIQEHGLEVMAGFILGFDSDPEDAAERQIQFIQKTAIPRAMVGLLIALPGTELYNRLEAEGRILGKADGNNTHCTASNFLTRQPRERLAEGYRRVLATIYDYNLKNYFERCSRLIDSSAKKAFTKKNGVSREEFRTFLRSLTRQLFTPYGFQYFRFLARTLVKHPKSFAEAVKFGVVGHHYYMITRKTLAAPAM
ncbi:MAG: B12-binding domain-containing radical SAM protein [Deltaproteobacteria bacterium]|nr:B12-binding domain-containing radical SAM protein [Deltaproteobacteria bacterium]